MSFSIGIISDTHGLLRPEAKQHLKTCDAIIHAGDMGSEDVLKKLKSIAPLYPVRGNVDWEPWSRNMPVNDLVEIEGKFFYIIHILDHIDLDPVSAGINVVIFGHTHEPAVFEKKNILYMNPGSAGPERYPKPITMGKIVIDGDNIHPEIISIG